MHWKGFLLFTIVGLATGAGCMSYSVPPNYREPEIRYWKLIDRDRQREILANRYDRERLRREVGPPTVDDGEEWVYVGKYEDTSVVPLDMLMAITASVANPTWKTVVVTFDTHGVVESINVGSTESAIAERKKQGILFGVYYDRPGRVRATTAPTTVPSGKTKAVGGL